MYTKGIHENYVIISVNFLAAVYNKNKTDVVSVYFMGIVITVQQSLY